MKRVIVVALGIATVFSSAAAINIGGALASVRAAGLEAGVRRTQDLARADQRAGIEARYQVERAKCVPLAGLKRDRCLISAHAMRGRGLLEAAAPYEERSRT